MSSGCTPTRPFQRNRKHPRRPLPAAHLCPRRRGTAAERDPGRVAVDHHTSRTDSRRGGGILPRRSAARCRAAALMYNQVTLSGAVARREEVWGAHDRQAPELAAMSRRVDEVGDLERSRWLLFGG